MKETNTKIFNKIKEARTIEEKVWLSFEYFENAVKYLERYDESIPTDELYILNFYEISEILSILGEKLNDVSMCPINSEFEASLLNLLEESSYDEYFTFIRDSKISFMKNQHKIAEKFLNILYGIRKRKCNVYVENSFAKFKRQIDADEKFNSQIYVDDMYDSYDGMSYIDDEYNLKPGDEGYEFSIAEALDNMYGK